MVYGFMNQPVRGWLPVPVLGMVHFLVHGPIKQAVSGSVPNVEMVPYLFHEFMNQPVSGWSPMPVVGMVPFLVHGFMNQPFNGWAPMPVVGMVPYLVYGFMNQPVRGWLPVPVVGMAHFPVHGLIKQAVGAQIFNSLYGSVPNVRMVPYLFDEFMNKPVSGRTPMPVLGLAPEQMYPVPQLAS